MNVCKCEHSSRHHGGFCCFICLQCTTCCYRLDCSQYTVHHNILSQPVVNCSSVSVIVKSWTSRITNCDTEHDCSVVVLSSASYKPELRGRLRATSERSKKLGETSQVVDSMEYTCAACQRNFTNLSVRNGFASCGVNRNRQMSDHIYWSSSLGWVSHGPWVTVSIVGTEGWNSNTHHKLYEFVVLLWIWGHCTSHSWLN